MDTLTPGRLIVQPLEPFIHQHLEGNHNSSANLEEKVTRREQSCNLDGKLRTFLEQSYSYKGKLVDKVTAQERTFHQKISFRR